MMLLLWIAFAVAMRVSACNDDSYHSGEDHFSPLARNNDPLGLFSPYYDPITETVNPWLAIALRSKNHADYSGVSEGRIRRPTFGSGNTYTNSPMSSMMDENDRDTIEDRMFGMKIKGLAALLGGGGSSAQWGNSPNPNKPSSSSGGGLLTRLPYIANPNYYPAKLASFDSCTAPMGESGICAPGAVCSLYGGRPSGTCSYGLVCCINVITACGGSVTVNNTYWQSPTTPVNSGSSCALTLKLNQNLLEQKKPVCQVRLDITFSIAQPNAETVCNTDTFSVQGATNTVPTLCGDATGQHMYLDVSDYTNNVNLQLSFNFGTSTTTRSWNIKMSMLPCGASYLAPAGCLKYYTSTTGSFHSFNWKDVAITAGKPRQLANMDYKVCFRTELVNGRRASTLCLTPCTVTNAPTAFSVSAENSETNGAVDTLVTGQSQNLPANCNNDYVVFEGGFDPNPGNGLLVTDPTNALDRFCGEAFNVQPKLAASATVCTKSRPFSFYYKTNGDETQTPTLDTGVVNLGYCFNFVQSV